MKKIAFMFMIIISFMLAQISGVFAEEKTGKSFSANIAFGGIYFTGNDDLNDELSKYNYQKVSDGQFTMGGSLILKLNRFVIGVEGHGFRSNTKTTGTYDTYYRGGLGLLNFGYVLLSAGDLSLFPLLGIGGGGIEYFIYENASPEFNNVMAAPGRGVHLSRGSMILNLSLRMEYLVKIVESGGVLFGLQAGYCQSIYGNDWAMFGYRRDTAGTEVKSGPDFDYTGFHGHISIGWQFLF